MKEFIEKHQDQIQGVLSCFDRMLFRGYLPIMSGWRMAQFFNSSGIRFRELKTFLVQNAERVKRHAMIIAEQEGRPYVYYMKRSGRRILPIRFPNAITSTRDLSAFFRCWSLAVRVHSGVKRANRSLPRRVASVCSCTSILSIAISA
jgi:hypothetical protein